MLLSKKEQKKLKQIIFSEISVGSAIRDKDYRSIIGLSGEYLAIYEKALEDAENNKGGKDYKKLQAFYSVGQAIKSYIEKKNKMVGPDVRWSGRDKIKSREAVPKDLEVAELVRVSVKEDADVFINGSPVNVFVRVPKTGIPSDERGSNWFTYIALDKIDHYYKDCVMELKNYPDYPSWLEELPSSVEEYFAPRRVDTKIKKKFGKAIKENLKGNIRTSRSYKAMCKAVSERSAETFNNNLRLSKKNLYEAFTYFFRLNGSPYILSGTESGKPFAVKLPSTITWSKSYEVLSIKARPKEAGQPEVIIVAEFLDKIKNLTFQHEVRVEVRWSHGKFCGNPEAKVYKKWSYTGLKWAEDIMNL